VNGDLERKFVMAGMQKFVLPRLTGHPRLGFTRARTTWMAGTSPAMTKKPVIFSRTPEMLDTFFSPALRTRIASVRGLYPSFALAPLASRRIDFAARLRGLLYCPESGSFARRAFELDRLRGQLRHFIPLNDVLPETCRQAINSITGRYQSAVVGCGDDQRAVGSIVRPHERSDMRVRRDQPA
jgi:hypothetical protein